MLNEWSYECDLSKKIEMGPCSIGTLTFSLFIGTDYCFTSIKAKYTLLYFVCLCKYLQKY